MQLKNYNGYGTLVRFCSSDKEISICQDHSRNALFIQDNTAVMVVDGNSHKYAINGEISFKENDTLYVNQNGFCRLIFPYEEYSQTIIVTNKCNSNCIMCPYTSSFRKSTNDSDDQFLFQQIEYLPSKTKHLVITGGEPTLKKDVFFEMMKKIYSRFSDIHCLLLTNGRSFSLESIIKEANVIFNRNIIIAIPIHASTAMIHDSITQTTGSFNQTIKGIKNLIHSNFHIELRIVVFKSNYKDMLNIANLIIKEFPQVYIVNFMAAEMCGNAVLNIDNTWIDYNEAFDYCKTAIDKLVGSGINVGLYNFPLCSIPHKYWGLYQKSISGYKVRFGHKCCKCSEKNICGGVFASSLKYAERNMKPLMENL